MFTVNNIGRLKVNPSLMKIWSHVEEHSLIIYKYYDYNDNYYCLEHLILLIKFLLIQLEYSVPVRL